MPYDPTRSIQDSPDLSPTTLILNQLRQRGVKPTAANVREAVLANARNSNEAGPDPVGGLRNMAPISSAGDPGVGQSGNVARKVAPGSGRGSGSRGGATPPMDRRDNTSSGAPKTSAPPGPDINELITPFAMGAGGAGAAYGLNRYLNRNRVPGGAPDAEFVGNRPMDPTGRTIDVPMTGIEAPGGGAQSRLPTPSVTPGAIEGPPPQLGGPGGPQSAVGAQGAAPPVSDMEIAMQRAIAPGGAGEVDLSGMRPYATPGDVRAPGMPPGISDLDAARAGIGSGGLDSPRVAGQVGVPDVNLPVRPRAPMPNIANPSGGDIAAQILRMFGGAR